MKALKLENSGVTEAEIDNSLEALQAAVDGYIETVRLVPGRAVMIVNEEGLLRDMPLNTVASAAAGARIVGPAIVVGVDGEEFTDVPADVAQCVRAMFS